ncbi:MAG: HDOD domain-containing protein [Thermoguttaceae bacterium]
MNAATLSDNLLKRLLARAALPALPQSAVRLLEVSRDPRCDPTAFAVPLESDPGLVSQVLCFVNSSYFGFAREISSIRTAIHLVGVQTIENFVLWSAIFSSIPDPKSGNYQIRVAWYDSLKRAVFARSMVKLLRAGNADDAFCAALLQDVAVPLLLKAEPEAYLELLEKRRETGQRLSDLERAKFGWTHGDAARAVCHDWHLPESLTEMIARHLEIERFDRPAPEPDVSSAVILSALLPSSLDAEWIEQPLFEQSYLRLAPRAGPSSEAFLEDVERQLKDLMPFVGIASDPLPANRRKLAAAGAAEET